MSGFTSEEFEPDPKGSDPGTGSNGAGTRHKGNGHDTEPWPVLGAAAYHGLAGEVVATLLPQTEADPVALLLQYLVYFGNAVGRGPYYQVENDRHFAILFLLLVGNTAKARKGLSANRVRFIFDTADPAWTLQCVNGGMSSGEGVLHAIRDPVYAMQKGKSVMTDPGVEINGCCSTRASSIRRWRS